MPKKKKDSLRTVEIKRPGIKGLVTGIAEEDSALESLVDMWNVRLDQLGRVTPRPGYGILRHSLNSAADYIMLVAPKAMSSSSSDIKEMAVGLDGFGAGANMHFYVDGNTIKSDTVDNPRSINYTRIDNENVPINLIAVNGKGLYKQYMSGATYRVATLPVDIGSVDGMTTFTEFAAGGTWQKDITYLFKVSFYNSVTGEEGKISTNSQSHKFTEENASVGISDVPLCTKIDEGTDIHRKIYSKISGSDDAYVHVGTIENNTGQGITITTAPDTTSMSESPYVDSITTEVGEFAPVVHAWGHTFVGSNNRIYFSTVDHSLYFDQTDNVIDINGQPMKFVYKNDRIYVWTTTGVYYIPRPVEVTAENLVLISLSSLVIGATNVRTIVDCGNMIVFRAGNTIRTIDGNNAIGYIALKKELMPLTGDYASYTNFAIYSSKENKYMMFCVIGSRFGGQPYAATQDVLSYSFDENIWIKDNYLGLYPCSACEYNAWIKTSVDDSTILIGGSYGVIAYLDRPQNVTAIVTTAYLYDGQQSALISGTATGGAATYLDDSAAAFTDSVIGNSCLIFRASVTGYDTKRWQLIGVHAIKSRTATRLTFGFSVSPVTPATGDIYYVGAIPWMIKFPSLMDGKASINSVEIEHAGSMSNVIILIPPSPETETGWMSHAATGIFQKLISDTRTGLKSTSVIMNMSADSPQLQLCGYASKPTISSIKAVLQKMKER